MNADRRDHVAECTRCHRTRLFVSFYVDGALVDTAGGMLFVDGWRCDDCLPGSSYADSRAALERWSS